MLLRIPARGRLRLSEDRVGRVDSALPDAPAARWVCSRPFRRLSTTEEAVETRQRSLFVQDPTSSPPRPRWWLFRDRLDGFDDLLRRNPEAVEQFFGLTAAGNLAHGKPVDGESGIGHGFRYRVADASSGIVIFDGNKPAAGRAAGFDETIAINGRDRVEIDYADCDA